MSKVLERALVSFFLGIDISKEKFDACCIGSNGDKRFRMSTSMSKDGFDELTMKISSITKDKESILIGMESTACYHINLYSFLTAKGFTVVIVNPLLISNFMKLQLRKTKTDKKDALVIAQILLIKKDSLFQNVLSAAASIGTASPAKEMLIKQKTAILKQLEDHLQKITDMLLEHCQAQMKDNIDILTSILGIGEKSATNFLIELGGDPGLFPGHRQVIAMAGLDPSIYQSGKYVGLSKISKRGNSHLRRIIWLMTVKVIQFEEHFRCYFERRMKKKG